MGISEYDDAHYFLFCAMMFYYNYLLSFNPIANEIVVFFVCVYLYLLMYIYWECN